MDTIEGTEGATAQAPEGQNEVQGAPESSGLQKRIDELVAQRHKAEAEAQAQRDLNSQLLERMRSLETGVQHAPQEEALPDMSELGEAGNTVAKYVQALTKKLETSFAERTRALEAQMAAAQVASYVNPQRDPPQVVARAQALISGWRQRGLTFGPEDALTFARGEAAAQGGYGVPPQAPARTPGYAANAQLGGGNPVPSVAPKAPALPRNFDMMTPDQQVAILQKVGLDDIPL